MHEYEEALEILNKNTELSVNDIRDIHDNFVNLAILLKKMKKEDIEADKYYKYLNAMNTVFVNRYKNSAMTAEEYQVWKQSLKDDFKDIPQSIKIEIKKLFIQRIIQMINNNLVARKVFEEPKNSNDYDKYYIKGIKEIEFNQIKIRYTYRVILMLIFLITISLVVSLFTS